MRELRNAIERAILLCDGGLITREHLPFAALQGAASPVRARPAADGGPFTEPFAGGLDLEAMERGYVERALRDARGNKSKAARSLGITRAQLYSRIQKFGLV